MRPAVPGVDGTRGFTLVELMVALFITAVMFTIGYRSLTQALDSRKEVDEQTARMLAIQKAIRFIEQDFELLQPRPVRNLVGDGYEPAITTGQTGLLTAAVSIGSQGSSGGSGSGAGGGLGSGLGSGGSGSGSNNSGSSFGSSSFGTGSSLSLGSSTLGSSFAAGNLGALSLDNSGTSVLCSAQAVAGSPVVTLTRAGWTNPAGLQRSELQRVSYFIDNDTLIRAYYPVLDATPGDAPIRRQLLQHVKSFSVRFMDSSRQCRSDWPAAALGAAAQGQALAARPVAVEVTLQLDDWGTLVRVIDIAG